MRALALIAWVTGSSALAAVMPTPDKTVNRSLPDEPALKSDTEYKRLYEQLLQKAEDARAPLRDAAGGATGVPPNTTSPVGAVSPATSEPAPNASPVTPSPNPSGDLSSDAVFPETPVRPRTLPRRTKVPPGRLSPSLPRPAYGERPATGTLVYAVSKEAAFDDTMTVLPAGSFVKARVVSGVEANTLEPYPVLLQLEYAFTGPNQTKIDLSNCFMIAKARANLSTERVIMETETLSCVRENGEAFKTVAKGYTAGEDSTFGSTGTFISKQGQVMLAAVLASIAKNAGDAIATAQQTTTVAAGGLGAAQTATNVTGDQAKYIAGRSVVDGAAMIAQWYLDYAKQLVPSIGIGSGQTVHVIMLDTVRVPTLTE